MIEDKRKYTKNNVEQCWSCKNHIGQQEYQFHGDPFVTILPECKVTELLMTNVHRTPCPYFEDINK